MLLTRVNMRYMRVVVVVVVMVVVVDKQSESG